MDKKLNRTIGYVKPATNKKYINDLSKISPSAGDMQIANKGLHEAILCIRKVDKAFGLSPEPPNKSVTAFSIVEWINTHPLFKWSGMCKDLGIDKGNFGRLLKSPKPEMKIEVLNKVVECLREYGFAGAE